MCTVEDDIPGQLSSQNGSKHHYPEDLSFPGGRRRHFVGTDGSDSDTVTPTKKLASDSSLSPVSAMNGSAGCEMGSERVDAWLGEFKQFSASERHEGLERLVQMFTHEETLQMSQKTHYMLKRDILGLLPTELVLKILSYLEPRDWLNVSLVCKRWYARTQDYTLWKEKCEEEDVDTSLLDEIRRKTSVPYDIDQPSRQYEYYKMMYVHTRRIRRNWKLGRCERSVMKGHDDHVITCLLFDGERIISGSDDNTLKVWDARERRLLLTLQGHNGGVWCSQLAGNTLVSGSTDRTIKIWDLKRGVCRHTLYGHSSTVRCLHLKGDRLVSGSRDNFIRLWSVETGNCLHVYAGHVGAVRCVQYDGRLIVSGGYDSLVKVWDADTEQCLHTFQDHTDRVYSLLFDGTNIISGSLDATIRVWDVQTGKCVHVLTGHQSLTSGMQLHKHILVSGNADSTVRVWDIKTGKCLHTLSGPHKHRGAVTAVHLDRKHVITSSDDGTVKLWCLQHGTFLRNLVDLTDDCHVAGCLHDDHRNGVVWRIKATNTQLVCAAGGRNGTEDTRLILLDYDM